MQSMFMAISDFISSFLYKADNIEVKAKGEVDKAVEKAPEGYRPLYFHCWLCKGSTKFALKNSIREKKFTIECSRCGVENTVTVNS